MLHLRHSYEYEYLGKCSHPVWTANFGHSLLTLLTAFRLKDFGLMLGDSGVGKMNIVREAVRMLGGSIVIRTVAEHFKSSTLIEVTLATFS